MDSTRTISELKSTFIWNQVRILSENLEPPEDWRNYAVGTEEEALPEKVIEDVLHKANAAAKQHNRIVYSSQAIHHVAHQIASLYWTSVSHEVQSQAGFAKGVEKTTDLSKHMNIVNLPLDLESQDANDEQNTRYQHFRERLASLDQQRQRRQRRLDQLRHLHRLLEPFDNPQTDIQPNLVTRDGDLAQELERMRMLVARVGGRISQQEPKERVQGEEQYLLPGSDQKLEALMDVDETGPSMGLQQVRLKRENSLVPLRSSLSPSLTPLHLHPDTQTRFGRKRRVHPISTTTTTTSAEYARSSLTAFDSELTRAPRSALMGALDKMKRLVGLNGRGANPIGDGVDAHIEHLQDSHRIPDNNDDAIIDHPAQLSDCAAIIEGATPSSASKAPFTRGHRRRSTHVSRRDLEKFQKEVLGVENPASFYDEENGTSHPINPYDPQLEDLNRAFAEADMSMNSGTGMSGNPGPGMFSGYAESTPGTPNMGNVSRPSMSPALSHPVNQVNGGGMAVMNGNGPMNAGHQMDLHHLYDMVLELSDVLKNNREVTKNIVASAEEIMKHGSSEGASAAMQQVNGEITASRISELERALAKEKRLVEEYKREQVENTKLIGEYETAVGTMVEQIRNYCQNNNMHFLYQKSHYNNLLQAERDAHLESRLDRDYWHTQTMRCAEMIRTAHRLRSEEEELPVRIVAGLQNEVRAYRNALGMEPEKPDEEYGWEILKDHDLSAE
ncbi:hypothetical protein N7528_001737 [Penicillium herquei]|nr:hypothetical protein N7528_001737 [Penicillium herquei]